MTPSAFHLVVDISLHVHKETVQGLVMPEGALHCQLGIQVILQHMTLSNCYGNNSLLACDDTLLFSAVAGTPVRFLRV